EAIRPEHVLDPLDAERQLPLEQEIDLLLVLVCVDAPALAASQHDQVDAEGLGAELPAQRLKALAVSAVERGRRDRCAVALVAHPPSIGAHTRAPLDRARVESRLAAAIGFADERTRALDSPEAWGSTNTTSRPRSSRSRRARSPDCAPR